MGYGRRAMNLLIQYYEGNIPSLEEGLEDKQISTLTGDEVNDQLNVALFLKNLVQQNNQIAISHVSISMHFKIL